VKNAYQFSVKPKVLFKGEINVFVIVEKQLIE